MKQSETVPSLPKGPYRAPRLQPLGQLTEITHAVGGGGGDGYVATAASV